MSNIRTGFSKYTFNALLVLLNNVIDKLIANATLFPDLPVPVATLQTLATAYATSMSKAIKGSDASRSARNAKAVQVKTALLATAEYVRMVALGNTEILDNSGFELMKQPTPAGPVGTPTMKSAIMTGHPGEVELIWSSRPGAFSYQAFQTDTDPTLPGTVWTPLVSTTKIRFKVTGLTAYKAYWFSVQALGSDGPGVMSDPIIGRAA
jgi:hypothetical protein